MLNKQNFKDISMFTPIEIRSLYTPLRFDLEIRLNFIRWYEKNKKLFKNNQKDFFKQAKQHLYFFQHTIIKVSNRNKNWNSRKQENSYKKKVIQFIKLYESIKNSGYKINYPINLYSSSKILPTESGKIVTRKYYIGDGWHRFASLIALNKPLLLKYFKIHKVDSYLPRDNTYLYIKEEKLGINTYIRFLSKFYNQNASKRDELLNILKRDSLFFNVELDYILNAFESGGNIVTNKKEKIKELLNSDKYDGHQRIELVDGHVLEGQDKAPMAKIIFDEIDLKGKTVLDVGTAYGFFCYETIKRGAEKAVGIEYNNDRYEVAKQINQIKEENVDIIKLNLEKDELKEEFDIVLLLNVVHHLTYPIESIKKLASISKELIIVEFPTPANNKMIRRSKLNRFFMWLVKDYPIITIGNKEYHNTYYFSKKAFKAIFQTHTKLFKKINFKKSCKDERWIAYCYR